MESTLQLKRSDFQSRVADYLGYGFGADAGDVAWDVFQTRDINNVIDNGVRQFYWPPVKEGEEAVEWSFLKPVATLVIPSGSVTVPLPDDFGGFEGPLLINDSTGNPGFWVKVPVVDVQLVLLRQSVQSTSTGRPVMVAEEPLRGVTYGRSNRVQMRVWPQPDQDYAAQVQYYLIPDALTAANPYCYGGAQHAETLEASVMAAAELWKDNQIGPRNQYWLQRLAASISLDRKHKPQTMGRNIDRSDDRWYPPLRRPDRDFGITTVYGQSYALLAALLLPLLRGLS